MEKKPDLMDILLLGDSYVKNDKRKFVGVPSFDYAHGYSDGLKASESQNERLLSALNDQIEQAMEKEREASEEHHPTGFYLGLEHAQQLINEIEKQ